MVLTTYLIFLGECRPYSFGLQLASQPAGIQDHRFGHWKIEDLSSLVTSFIMFVGLPKSLFKQSEKIF